MSGSAVPPAAQPSAQPAPKRPILLAAIFLAAGVGLSVLAWLPVAEVRHLAANGVRAEARVYSVEEHRRRGVSTYYPIFVFRTADGRVTRERSAVSVSSLEPYRGGRTVEVVYDPADTSTVRPAASVAEGPGALPWIFGGFALAAFGLGALVLFKRPAAAAPASTTGGASRAG